MCDFTDCRLPIKPTTTAPDGSDVRVLLRLSHGSVAHFELAPGNISKAGAHRTVEEIWFFLNGRGEMWRKFNDRNETVAVEKGVCVTIPVGTHFQFRSYGYEPLSAIGVTMPPWPDDDKEEWYEVEGEWMPSLDPN